MNQNVQQFPSGEIRVYRFFDGKPVLHTHVRAEGDTSKEDHTGKTVAEMNVIPPYEAPVNVEPKG